MLLKHTINYYSPGYTKVQYILIIMVGCCKQAYSLMIVYYCNIIIIIILCRQDLATQSQTCYSSRNGLCVNVRY